MLPHSPPPSPTINDHVRPTIHAAIILTCSRPQHLIEKFGTVASDFTRLLEPYFSFLSFRVFDGCQGEIPEEKELQNVDLLILPGSFHMVTDELEWIPRLEELIRKRKCWIFGVCFGMQLACKTYGGTVTWNPKGVEVGVSTIDYDRQIIESDLSELKVLQSHDMHISSVPEGFKVIAWNDHTRVQAVLSEEMRVIGVQFHPDFAADYFHYTRECRKATLEQAEQVLVTKFDNEPILKTLQHCILSSKKANKL